MKKCIVNFSGRKNGNCENIANIISQSFNNENIEIINFFELDIHPCTRCNYECFVNNEYCPYYTDDIKDVYERILESDFVYFIVPNYCDYPCANFFIFNERSNCIFQQNEDLLNKYLNITKKFIVVSNTNEDNFKNTFMYHTNRDPDVLFLSAKKYEQKSIDGKLMENESAQNDLIEFLS